MADCGLCCGPRPGEAGEQMKGHWNYRVVRYIEYGEVCYGIHEAHYYEGQQIPYSITETATSIVAENGNEMQQALTNMQAALTKPVLDYETREEVSKRAAMFEMNAFKLESAPYQEAGEGQDILR
jgi:hypothetical protein